jgi:hypothetical protein
MSFRKYGGLQFSSKHNAVASNYNTINKLQVSEDVGQPNSHILVESDLWCHGNIDISGNLRVNGTSILNGDVSCYSNVDISGNLRVNGTSILNGDVSCYSNLDISGNLRVYGTSSMYKPLTMTSTNASDRTINSTFYQFIDYNTGVNYGDGMYITSTSGNNPVWNFNINRPNGSMNFVTLDASGIAQKGLLQLFTTKVNLFAETQIQQDLLSSATPALSCKNSNNTNNSSIGLYSNLGAGSYGPNVVSNYVGLIATDISGNVGPPLIVKTHDTTSNGMFLGGKTAYFGYGGAGSKPTNRIDFDASINKTILISDTNCPELGGTYTAVPSNDSSSKIATTAWVQSALTTTGCSTIIYTTSQTITLPTFNRLTILCVSGGGGGGWSTTSSYGGSGGTGSVVYSEIINIPGSALYPLSFVVGTFGAAAPSSGTNGSDGGNSSVTFPSGYTMTAGGGKGGTTTTGGLGGVISGTYIYGLAGINGNTLGSDQSLPISVVSNALGFGKGGRGARSSSTPSDGLGGCIVLTYYY